MHCDVVEKHYSEEVSETRHCIESVLMLPNKLWEVSDKGSPVPLSSSTFKKSLHSRPCGSCVSLLQNAQHPEVSIRQGSPISFCAEAGRHHE